MAKKPKEKNEPVYTDFDQLFIDEMKARPDLIEQCYQVLKDEGFIGDNLNYITGKKGAFVVWQLALQINGLLIPRLKKGHNNTIRDLLNKKFEGLNLWPSAVREKHETTKETYLHIFKKNLPMRTQVTRFTTGE